MNLLSFLFKLSKGPIIVAAIVGFLGGIGNATLIALVNTTLNQQENETIYTIGFIIAAVVVLFGGMVSQILLVRLAQSLVYNLRIQLSQRILRAPLRHLEEIGVAKLLATLTGDAANIANASIILPVLLTNIVVLFSSLVYLGFLSWQLLLTMLGFMALGIATYQLLLNRAIHYFNLTREESDVLYAQFDAITKGTKELKLHACRRQSFFEKRLTPSAARSRDYSVTAITIYSVAANWGRFLFFGFIGLLVFVFPRFFNMDAELLTGYTLVTLFIMTPMEVILNAFPDLGQASVAFDKVEKLGLSLAEVEEPQTAVKRWAETTIPTTIHLAGITHTYHREKEDLAFELGPIDLELSHASLTFLVGGNGSGKTTLAKLLIGLYTPESGQIFMDDQPIDEQNREQYRQLFTAVFSDFYLFKELLGMSDVTLDAQAEAYLEKLHLNHKVSVKDGQLSTTELSQGQRKRLALLTAYLEDRPFYIFDEWAADQDPIFKEIFYKTLLPELKKRGKGILVITHDDHYFHMADHIVKLYDGQMEPVVRKEILV